MRRVGFIILGAFAEQNVCKQSTAAEHIDIDSLYQHDITCGGALPNRGRLEGPVLPHRDEYPSLCDCTWTIGGDFENEFATIWLNFLHFKIDHSAGHCTNDFVEIYSSGGESRVIDPICGDTLPESINRRVQLPVIIKFKSDEDVEHSSGFKIEYSVVPDDSSVEAVQSGEIRTGSAPETKKSSAPTGLIIGLLLIAIVALVAFIVHKKRKQTKERGMDGLEMPTLTPTENVYEILDASARDESVLLRTESQESIAQEKLAAQFSTRALPDLPSTSNANPYSETP